MPQRPTPPPSLPARLIWSSMFLLAVASPAALRAQVRPDQPPPAHVDVVEGQARLDRDGERLDADAGMLLVAGDRLSTGNGRLQLLTSDAVAMAVDDFTNLTLESSGLFRLRAGRVRVTVRGGTSRPLQIDTPTASALIDTPGEYRISMMGSASYSQTEMVVFAGYGELESDRGSVRLRAGERSVSWPNDLPSRPAPFARGHEDAFDRWVTTQRGEGTGRSAQHLPLDLRAYGGTLDQHGTWGFEGGFGYVWYPAVGPGWRLYFDGYWATVAPYGWVWVGLQRWAWPTHHYGRWGFVRNRWFWMPDRRWAPAWVSWGVAPGYVAWCPLGFDDRPLFDVTAPFPAGGGWTVLPRDRFGHRAYVSRYAIAPRALPAHASLVPQARPPAPPSRVARPPDARRSLADRAMPRDLSRDRAVPRVGPADRGVPSARPPLPGGAVVDRVPSARPFGDFRGDRREPSSPAPAPPGGGRIDSARPPRAVPRDAAPRQQQPGVNLPPPPPAGVARPRSESTTGGAIGRPAPQAAPRSGAAEPGGRGDGRGSTQDRQGRR